MLQGTNGKYDLLLGYKFLVCEGKWRFKGQGCEGCLWLENGEVASIKAG